MSNEELEQQALYPQVQALSDAGNTDEALKILEQLASQGDCDAMLAASDLLFQKNTKASSKKGFKYLLTASKQTDKVNDKLCVCYGLGIGTKISYIDAFMYGKMALEQNPNGEVNPGVYLVLGKCYADGKGTLKDVCQAYRYLKLAEEYGLKKESEDILLDLRQKYPFTQDGEINLSISKRSSFATFFILIVLLYNLLAAYIGIKNSSFGLISLSAFNVTSCLSLLFWKKWGLYTMLAMPIICLLSIFLINDENANAVNVFYLLGCFTNIPCVVLILLFLQKRRKGYAIAWNSLTGMRDDGRNNFKKLIDIFLLHGEGPEYLSKSPESKRFKLISYLFMLLIGGLALWAAISIMEQTWNMEIEWNCFKNPRLLTSFSIIGFFLQFAPNMWIHTSYNYVNVYKDQSGRVTKVEDNHELGNFVEGNIVVPVISHLFLYPLMIGAAIYYIIMAGYAALQGIMPYIVGALILASTWYAYRMLNKMLARKFRIILIPLVGIFFTIFYTIILGVANADVASFIKSNHLEQIPFKKLVVLTSNNINLRQGPDAKTPKLIRSNGVEASTLVWSDDPLTANNEAVRAKYLPVIDETGDWYKAIYNEPDMGQEIVYVKKEFCRDVQSRALTLPAPKYIGDIYEINDGEYKGVILNCCPSRKDVKMLRIGKRLDGAIAFEHHTDFDISAAENDKNLYFKESCMLQINEKLCNKDKNGSNVLDLKKLASDMEAMDYLMSNLDEMNNECQLFYGIEGNDVWHSLYVE